jgi:hypothetical protein
VQGERRDFTARRARGHATATRRGGSIREQKNRKNESFFQKGIAIAKKV